jgi:hypothetical protein
MNLRVLLDRVQDLLYAAASDDTESMVQGHQRRTRTTPWCAGAAAGAPAMRGHVHRRGSTWTAVYDEGTREDGKRRQRTKGGFTTRKQAQAFLTAQLQRLGEGSYAAPSKLTSPTT